MECP
jgi:hypothetical protein